MYSSRDGKCGQEERKNLPQYVMYIVLDDKGNIDVSSMGFNTATKSVKSSRRGIIKQNDQWNSDDDNSLDSANTAFINKAEATTK